MAKIQKKTTSSGGGCFVRIDNGGQLFLSAEIRDFIGERTNIFADVSDNVLTLIPTNNKCGLLITKSSNGKTSISGWNISNYISIERNKRYYANIVGNMIVVKV